MKKIVFLMTGAVLAVLFLTKRGSAVRASYNEVHRTPQPVVAVLGKVPELIRSQPETTWVGDESVLRIHHLMKFRNEIITDLNLTEVEWLRREWTEAYFSDLLVRRDRARQWSVRNTPIFVMIGVQHTAPGNSPEEAEEARFRDAYQRILQERGGQPLFVYEEASDHRPITWLAMQEAKQRAHFRETGEILPLSFIEGAIFKTSPQTLIVRNHQDDFVPIGGEEWLTDLHMVISHLTSRGQQLGGPRLQSLERLKDEIIWLRSEVSIIRTIEAMQETGKRKAVLYMGAFHAQDIEAYQPVYGYKLTVYYAGDTIVTLCSLAL